jgi:type IV secretion system protein VirB2
LVFVLTQPSVAHAAGTGLPWEGVIQALVDSLTGPVVRGCVVVSIVVFGLLLAFSNPGPVWQRAIQVIFGLSLATGAASIAATLLPITSGATF